MGDIEVRVWGAPWRRQGAALHGRQPRCTCPGRPRRPAPRPAGAPFQALNLARKLRRRGSQVEAKKERSLSKRVQSLSRFLLEALNKEVGAGGVGGAFGGPRPLSHH